MRLFKVEDATTLLSLGRNTIFELIRTGCLRHVGKSGCGRRPQTSTRGRQRDDAR
jgi:hypothetical protein